MANIIKSVKSIPLYLPQLRWILVPVVWVIVAILATRVAFRDQMATLVVGGIAVFAGMIVLLRWPGLGFPLMVISALLIPLRIRTGTMTSINIVLILAVGITFLWLFEMVARDRRVRFLHSGIMLPSFLFILVASLSFLFGQLNWYPTRAASTFAQLGGLIVMIASIATLVVAAHRLQNIIWVKYAVWSLIILGGIYAVAFLFPQLRLMLFRTYQRAVTDSLFWTWLSVMAFSQAYLNTKLAVRWRILSGVIAGVTIFNLIVIRQAWTSGWLPAAIAIFVVLLMTRPRWAIALAILTGLFALIGTDIANEILLGGDNEYSLVTRLEAWRILFQIIELNPLFGLGPANYYFYTPFYDILGYSVSFNSHNQYIDILAQIGILGLFFFLWLFAAVWRTGWQIRAKVENGFERAFVYATLGGIAGTLAAGMLGDWIMPFVYNVGMEGFRSAVLTWLFMGALVFVAQRYKEQESEIAPHG